MYSCFSWNIDKRMIMILKILSRISACIVFSLLLTIFSACYQAHSDDDLRTVPVTNNPHVVPQSANSRMTAFGY
jgi:cell division septal protein FtsQ